MTRAAAAAGESGHGRPSAAWSIGDGLGLSSSIQACPAPDTSQDRRSFEYGDPGVHGAEGRASEHQTTVLEPRFGGRFYERFTDGDELQVGSVVVCEPPRRITFIWKMADWEGETEVEVTFTPHKEGTRVELEHRGFERLGSIGPDIAAKFRGGWPGVLATYTRRAARP